MLEEAEDWELEEVAIVINSFGRMIELFVDGYLRNGSP